MLSFMMLFYRCCTYRFIRRCHYLLIKKLLTISNKKNSNQLDIENRFDRVEDELNSMNKGK